MWFCQQSITNNSQDFICFFDGLQEVDECACSFKIHKRHIRTHDVATVHSQKQRDICLGNYLIDTPWNNSSTSFNVGWIHNVIKRPRIVPGKTAIKANTSFETRYSRRHSCRHWPSTFVYWLICLQHRHETPADYPGHLCIYAVCMCYMHTYDICIDVGNRFRHLWLRAVRSPKCDISLKLRYNSCGFNHN